MTGQVILSAIAMICIATLTGVALVVLHIDGMLLVSACSVIAGIAGYSVKSVQLAKGRFK